MLLALLIGVEVHFGVEAITNAPIDVGGRISIELPLGFELSTEVGLMPPFYSEAINGILLAARAYPNEVGALVRTGLQSAFVFRAHLAYRIWRGLYAAVGYGLVTLGGGLTAGEVLAAVSGEPAPEGFAPGENVRLSSSLHMVDAELGWRFLFFDQLIVRAAIGGAFTVGSDTAITTDRRLLERSAQFQDFAGRAERFLDRTYRAYVFAPVITLAVGYRFF